MTVGLVHDYLTQRGGAERVVLSMLRAFPEAPLYVSTYSRDGTFPDFEHADVRTLPLDRARIFRRDPRLALHLLAPSFSRLRVHADVVLCSTSGWAHGVRASGRKVVYCHTPARWLYQSERYLGRSRTIARAALAAGRRPLVRWDRAAAASADRYLVNSRAVRDRVREVYGIEAEVVPPPQTIDAEGARRPLEGIEPGFFLCVSRLLPYKNVDAVAAAFADLPRERLVVAGSGPAAAALRAAAPPNVHFTGEASDDEIRWLYASCTGLVTASYEDYGLTPLEAAAFGRPAAVLRWGGFLDTVVDGETGVFFDAPEPACIRDAILRVKRSPWDEDALRAHADRYSERRFVERLREVVRDVKAA